MALSSHLVNSFEHQRALETHRRQYPVPQQGIKREPFTPQYIITQDPVPEPIFEPRVSDGYNASHGRPLPGQPVTSSSTSTSTSTKRMEDRKPPITQRQAPPPSHAFALPPPSPLNNWEHAVKADPDYTQTSTSTSYQPRAQAQAPSYTHGHMPDPSADGGTTTTTTNTQGGNYVRMSEYTAGQIATLQSRLQKQLGPEYINHRPGPGGGPALSYIEGWKAINLANEVFGFNGWSSQIISLNTDFCDEPSPGRYNIGITAIIRITLRDGTFHEDTGYGGGDNLKGKGSALDKAKKEAVTDGIKRTLRMFGNVLGNCLYDKKFLKDIQKVKVVPKPLRPEDLWRRPEYDEAFQASAQAGPSRPHPMNDLSSQQPIQTNGWTESQIKDEQGFVKPALPARLLNQNGNNNVAGRTAQAQPTTTTTNGTPNRPSAGPPKDAAARAAGAQARAKALAAAGASIVRPTTTAIEESYAQDDELFANMAMDAEDPSVGVTSTDLLTAEEVGMDAYEGDETLDDLRTDGFGAPPPPPVAPGPPPSLQRGHSAGGFVYPTNQLGNIVDNRQAESVAKKLSPTEAAAKRRQAIAAQLGEESVGDTSGSTDGGGSSSRGMKRINPDDGDGFGYSKPGRHSEILSARKVLGQLSGSEVPYPSDVKRIRS